MKKAMLLLLALTVLVGVLFADNMVPGPQKQGLSVPVSLTHPKSPDREPATFEFSLDPITLVNSYYDYMIGGYNDLPMGIVPSEFGGGYFITFHGQRTATGQRRVFYAYIGEDGVLGQVNEITTVVNREGYPSMSVDPMSGKPMYAWHANADGTTDTALEVQFAYDAFLGGAPGLISGPFTIVDNPITVTTTNITPARTSTDNEFIWPTVQIGPSPNAGMRRVYVLSRNSASTAATHTGGPSENAWIKYADFNADMLENGETLTWSTTSIPEMNDWNMDPVTWRRPFHAFTVGNDGRLYYAGYHFAQDIASTESIDEPDMDVFVCDNYGAGNWHRVSEYSNLPSWNPPTTNGTGPGYFVDDSTPPVPFTNDQLYWSITNSAHINAVMDADGNVRVAMLMAQANTAGTYWPSFQVCREFMFNPDTETFRINEIYPVAGTPMDDNYWLPWDENADHQVDEYDTETGDPLMVTMWPFPYWDQTVHDNAMMFHYNNLKMTEPNEEGQMVAIWEDSNYARYYNEFAVEDYAAYATVPQIMIACSPDNGHTWSDPIIMDSIDTPELADQIPMWVYPANKVIPNGMSGQHEVGKIGIMYYDDNSWGSYVNTPPVGSNDGGAVKFMELNITFPLTGSEDTHNAPAITMLKQNYPNPFNPVTNISFNLPKAGNATLNVYNAKGQLVRTLFNGVTTSGDHKVVWEGKDNSGNSVASGLYFYKLTANGKTESRKMMLMK